MLLIFQMWKLPVSSEITHFVKDKKQMSEGHLQWQIWRRSSGWMHFAFKASGASQSWLLKLQLGTHQMIHQYHQRCQRWLLNLILIFKLFICWKSLFGQKRDIEVQLVYSSDKMQESPLHENCQEMMTNNSSSFQQRQYKLHVATFHRASECISRMYHTRPKEISSYSRFAFDHRPPSLMRPRVNNV